MGVGTGEQCRCNELTRCQSRPQILPNVTRLQLMQHQSKHLPKPTPTQFDYHHFEKQITLSPSSSFLSCIVTFNLLLCLFSGPPVMASLIYTLALSHPLMFNMLHPAIPTQCLFSLLHDSLGPTSAFQFLTGSEPRISQAPTPLTTKPQGIVRYLNL